MSDNISLQLVNTIVQELHLTKAKEKFDTNESAFSLGLAVGLPEENSNDCKNFDVTFKSEFQLKEGFILKVEYRAIFETDVPIDATIKNGNKKSFLTVNAPAIAFPFFRAFIATFLTNSGFIPIILPSINFLKLSQEQDNLK